MNPETSLMVVILGKARLSDSQTALLTTVNCLIRLSLDNPSPMTLLISMVRLCLSKPCSPLSVRARVCQCQPATLVSQVRNALHKHQSCLSHSQLDALQRLKLRNSTLVAPLNLRTRNSHRIGPEAEEFIGHMNTSLHSHILALTSRMSTVIIGQGQARA